MSFRNVGRGFGALDLALNPILVAGQGAGSACAPTGLHLGRVGDTGVLLGVGQELAIGLEAARRRARQERCLWVRGSLGLTQRRR